MFASIQLFHSLELWLLTRQSVETLDRSYANEIHARFWGEFELKINREREWRDRKSEEGEVANAKGGTHFADWTRSTEFFSVPFYRCFALNRWYPGEICSWKVLCPSESRTKNSLKMAWGKAWDMMTRYNLAKRKSMSLGVEMENINRNLELGLVILDSMHIQIG